MNQTNWEQAWLQYGINRTEDFGEVTLVREGAFSNRDEEIIRSARGELMKAFRLVPKTKAPQGTKNIVYRKSNAYGAEGYRLSEENGTVTVEGGARGILYGTFALIRKVACGEKVEGIDETQIPYNPIRMLDHWDNFDGSIERGYSGNSFFFDNDLVVTPRTKDYARLCASVGINAVCINNVNVRAQATKLIMPEYFDKLNELGSLFASYGIKLFLSIDFAAPIDLGGMQSADPCDYRVCEWWKKTCFDLFTNVPSMGGFLVKADSEGRPGPFTYGRNHAQGANAVARAIAPFGGILIWRCFVYNCTQDWRDTVTDRAKAGYDTFHNLDGQFDENVILQVKNGPMDFQIREPMSPLFGAMPHTNQMLEVQIAQEYTGQQKHVCYLIPRFKEMMFFNTYCRKPINGEDESISQVASIVSGRCYADLHSGGSFGLGKNGQLGGICAVANTGDDENWTGHDLAAANWFGFGMLAWNPFANVREFTLQWCRMTFGRDDRLCTAITDEILMKSADVYEKYNAPLGIGWMCQPNNHYGPNVDGYEYDRWGTYHRADYKAIGVERSTGESICGGPVGTGYTAQYFEPNASLYANVETCPDELVLFFHRLPYIHVLHSGKTVIQHIYDTHFEGAEEAEKMMQVWEGLKEKLDPVVFERTLKRFEHQTESAKEWRDRINTYFFRKSGIGDDGNRKIY